MVDGGLGANNPTLQTIPVARQIAEERSNGTLKGEDALQTVATLSLGTGDQLLLLMQHFLLGVADL